MNAIGCGQSHVRAHHYFDLLWLLLSRISLSVFRCPFLHFMLPISITNKEQMEKKKRETRYREIIIISAL
jgi:hypothetical protein